MSLQRQVAAKVSRPTFRLSKQGFKITPLHADCRKEEPRAGQRSPRMDRSRPWTEIPRRSSLWGRDPWWSGSLPIDQQARPRICQQNQFLRWTVQNDGKHQQVSKRTFTACGICLQKALDEAQKNLKTSSYKCFFWAKISVSIQKRNRRTSRSLCSTLS